jgi:hypothetical protein
MTISYVQNIFVVLVLGFNKLGTEYISNITLLTYLNIILQHFYQGLANFYHKQ